MVAGWLYRKGQWFVLTGISSYYDMDWPSPAFNASAKIPIHEFIEYLIYCHGIPQSSIRFPYVPRSVSRLCILFHWPIHLSLC